MSRRRTTFRDRSFRRLDLRRERIERQDRFGFGLLVGLGTLAFFPLLGYYVGGRTGCGVGVVLTLAGVFAGNRIFRRTGEEDSVQDPL